MPWGSARPAVETPGGGCLVAAVMVTVIGAAAVVGLFAWLWLN